MVWHKIYKEQKHKRQKLNRKRQLIGKYKPWFQTFQSENDLLKLSWGYTAVQQPQEKPKTLRSATAEYQKLICS